MMMYLYDWAWGCASVTQQLGSIRLVAHSCFYGGFTAMHGAASLQGCYMCIMVYTWLCMMVHSRLSISTSYVITGVCRLHALHVAALIGKGSLF